MSIQEIAGNESSVTCSISTKRKGLGRALVEAFGWSALAIAAMHASYTWGPARPAVMVYLFALFQLARQDRWRLAFYPGLAAGFGIAALQLTFFWTLFSFAALALWLVLAFWIGLFPALGRLAFRRFGSRAALLAIPILWTGLEFFRSELYPLRFSWVTPGFAFAAPPWTGALNIAGVYGIGFLLVCIVCAISLIRKTIVQAVALGLATVGLGWISNLQSSVRNASPAPSASVRVAGVQMEFPDEKEVLVRLREVLKWHPTTQLIVLSEYTFTGPVPQPVRDWCAENGIYLVVGGKAPAAGGKFYNTAFVVDPDGEIVFQQAKSVPIQFMRDGLPAEQQEVWESPWGRIGICICYDLSYTRVTDALVRKGAELLIVPTMDVIAWGKAQHELHARVAPVRAAEYATPVFRIASSGISQYVDKSGRILAHAPCPGDGAIIASVIPITGKGRLPADRWLAPVCVLVSAGFILFFTWEWFLARRAERGQNDGR